MPKSRKLFPKSIDQPFETPHSQPSDHQFSPLSQFGNRKSPRALIDNGACKNVISKRLFQEDKEPRKIKMQSN